MGRFTTKWNWGAFMFPYVFAITTRSWLLFLNFVPILNIFWMFYGAFKAEEWALENPNNTYRDSQEFRLVMDGLNRAGFIMFICSLAVVIFYVLFFGSMLTAVIGSSGY